MQVLFLQPVKRYVRLFILKVVSLKDDARENYLPSIKTEVYTARGCIYSFRNLVNWRQPLAFLCTSAKIPNAVEVD
jgi:hypothetical protein